MRFPFKKNAGCPKTPGDFLPRSGILPLPQSPYGRTFANVTTKFSRIVRLPNLLSNGALLARYVRGLRYKNSLKQLTLYGPFFFLRKMYYLACRKHAARKDKICVPDEGRAYNLRRPLDCIKFALRTSFILNLTCLHNNNSSFVYCLQITVSYKGSPLYTFYFNRWIAAWRWVTVYGKERVLFFTTINFVHQQEMQLYYIQRK